MSEIQITDKTMICRSDSLLSNNLGEDVVMMDIEEGSYYGLEAVAASIWKLTEKPVSIDSVCDQLMGDYDVQAAQCNEEVKTFAKDMIERGILRIVD